MLKLLHSLQALAALLLGKAEAAQSFDKALRLNDAGKYGEAFPLMKQAAEAGNARAMSLLGGMYLMGRGSPENGNEAERWLRRAMAEGDADAASLLGMAYATGKAGIRQNIALAKELLKAAAAHGDEKAKQMLEAIDARRGIFRHLKP